MSHLQAVCGPGRACLQVLMHHYVCAQWTEEKLSPTMQCRGLVLIKIYFGNVWMIKVVALFGNGISGNVVIHVLLSFQPSVSVASTMNHFFSCLLLALNE